MQFYGFFYYTYLLTFYWNNELRNDRKNLVSTMFQHVMNSLTSKKLMWKCHFTKAMKKNRQIGIIVQAFYLYLKIQNK